MASIWALQPHTSSFVISRQNLLAPSADRRETFLLDRYLAEFYNASPKLGALSKKTLGQNMQNFCGFYTIFHREYPRNEYKDIQNQKDMWPRTIPSRDRRKKSGELWSTNYKVEHDYNKTNSF